MFYYPNVLQRHTGCFATIWLAATGAGKLLKREYLKVNVPQTCEEIMAFILVRVPPPVPGAPRPRFSLYLSAQLQYGVILVYSRQCQYLVEEIQHTLERLSRAHQQIRIDLTDLEQPGLLLPDQLALMEALEEAPDPFFGMMEPVLPSPLSIPHIRDILEAPTPERSPPERPPPSVPPRRAGKPVITVSPEAITLKESEPITLLKIEGEQDLPEITAGEIDLLVEQEGFLVPGAEEGPLSPQVAFKKRRVEEESVEEARAQEPWVSLGLSPPTGIVEETLAVKEMGLLLREETQPSVSVPLQPLEITPPAQEPKFPPSPRSPRISPKIKRPAPLSPELRLPEYEPSPPRPSKRRRQLRFMDVVTQISREDFQKQIADPHTQCQPLEMVLLPAKRLKTPAELLGNPTYGWMHPTLHGFWSRCAHVQQVNYAKQRFAEEEARRAEVPSELEELRAAEEPSGPPVGSSEISLETTEEEPRPSLVITEERILLEPEEGILPVVPELPEISFELPLEKDVITLDYVRRLVAARLEQVGEIDFDQLVPLTASRAVASRFFYICLVLAAAQILHLEQMEAYGPITIKPGSHFPPS
ncbi:meiotic recombination protein REC8 homolog [Python bivittatus]|uniref:Meiotic recombination protein REC8 homolog n=1 Tax=Python bivittatus TaxID=176946 RepID=A0A9F5IVP8_PYTBI|nr:meiotic recombination protein REC8 homolog [Python bivittatus]